MSAGHTSEVSQSAGSGDAGPAAGWGVRWGRAIVVILPLVLLAVLYVFDIPVCPSRHLLGLPCPGCGLTRASVALATLDFDRAFAMHPLVPVILPIVAWGLARTVLGAAGLVKPGLGGLERLPRWVWSTLVIVVLGVWGLRLAGGLGGLPDPIAPSQGLLGRLVSSALG